MTTVYRKLSRDTITYGIGESFAKIIYFLLILAFIRLFSPEYYGYIELLVIINYFLGVLISMGTDEAMTYFFAANRQNNDEHINYIVAILQWRLTWGGLLVVLSVCVSSLINFYLFNSLLTLKVFVVAFGGTLFLQLMEQSATVFRLIYQPARYILIIISNIVVSRVVSIYCIYILNWGIWGYFLGYCLGAIVAGGIGWWGLRHYLSGWRNQTTLWPTFLKFGLPLVPATVAAYLLNATDRWFINYYAGPTQLGIYVTGAKFALMIGLLIQIFMRAFMPVSMDMLNEEDQQRSNSFFEIVFRYYLALSISAAILITMCAPAIIRFLIPEAYYQAHSIIGILALSSIFFGGTYFSTLGSWKVKKTHLYSVSVIIAFFVNVLLNIILIPMYDINGAAIATSTGMLCLTVISFYLSHREWEINFSYINACIQVAISIIVIGWLTVLNIELNAFTSMQGLIVGIALVLLWITTVTWRPDMLKLK